MPIYEYKCAACDHRLEALQKMSDIALLDCPECAKPALIKLVSAASFRLKGGGWYETDFKTGDKKQLADSDSDSKSGAAADTDSKDSKDSKGGNEGSKEDKQSKSGKDSEPAKSDSSKAAKAESSGGLKSSGKSANNTSNKKPAK